MLTIRASSLPGYSDCQRRTAAKMFREEIENAGYRLRTTKPHIGGAVGTAMHAGAAYSMLEKKNTGEIGNATEAEQRALQSLDEGVQEEIQWDDVADNLNSAQLQTLSLVRACREHVVPHITPVEVEVRLEAKVSEDIMLSGQVDINEEYGLVDWKSGKRQGQYGAQYGAYSLLAKTHFGKENKKAAEAYIKRVKEHDKQPKPVIRQYNVASCENTALGVLRHIERDLKRWRETGDVREWLANPSSVLCSEKFCPARGTEFCKDYQD